MDHVRSRATGRHSGLFLVIEILLEVFWQFVQGGWNNRRHIINVQHSAHNSLDQHGYWCCKVNLAAVMPLTAVNAGIVVGKVPAGLTFRFADVLSDISAIQPYRGRAEQGMLLRLCGCLYYNLMTSQINSQSLSHWGKKMHSDF